MGAPLSEHGRSVGGRLAGRDGADEFNHRMERRNHLLRKENDKLRRVVETDRSLTQQYYKEECKKCLTYSFMFQSLDDAHLDMLVGITDRKRYKKGDIIVRHGEPHDMCYLVASGEVLRTRVEEDGRLVSIDMHDFNRSIGTLCILTRQPALATAECLTDVVVYSIAREPFVEMVRGCPSLALQIANSLSTRIKDSTVSITPLLASRSSTVSVGATSLAAVVDTLYRSVMNASFSRTIAGRAVPYFAHAPVQIPARVVYVNVLKGGRALLEQHVTPTDYAYPGAVSFAMACAPGIMVLPMSSLVEAVNVGDLCPEKFPRRCWIGMAPRGVREVVIAIGLNQVTDYLEERLPFSNHTTNVAVGSAVAGLISGYFSHLPHSLLTMRLLQPAVPYSELLARYCKMSQRQSLAALRLPYPVTVLSAILFPKGVVSRSCHTAGSFAIINGVISALKDFSPA